MRAKKRNYFTSPPRRFVRLCLWLRAIIFARCFRREQARDETNAVEGRVSCEWRAVKPFL